MTRIALLSAAALALTCLGPAPASAQFFSCAQIEDITQRMNCNRWQDQQLRQQYLTPAPPARVQPAPTPVRRDGTVPGPSR